jgi:hypothetical protein
MLWHHCSTTDDEACGGGGLLSSWCAATSVPSVAIADGSVTAVVAVQWCCVASVVATVVMAAVRPPLRRDRPTLEQEVASTSVPCSLREG